MNRISKISAAALCMVAVAPALRASDYVEVSSYSEGFETSVSSGITGDLFAAKFDGWGAITDSWTPEGSTTVKQLTYKTSSSNYTHGGSYELAQTTSHKMSYYDFSSSSTIYQEVEDYLVSPEVKGTVTLYARRYSTSSSSQPVVKIYDCTQNAAGEYEVGELLADFTETLTAVTSSYTWTACSVDLPDDEYHHLAIWLDYVYVDDFSATSAKVPAKRKLTIGSWSFPTGYSNTVNQNDDGTIDVHGIVTVTNSGNVPLSPDDEDCYMQLLRSNQDNQVFYDYIKLPQEIAAGESASWEFEYNIVLPEDVTSSLNSSNQYRIGLMWKEMLGGTTNAIKWFDINPNIPIMSVKYGSSTYKSKDVIDYGIGSGEATADFTICNRGAKDLTINGVSCPEALSVILPEGYDYPLTIEPQGTLTVSIKMAADTSGAYGGSVVFDVPEGTMTTDSDGNATNIIKINGSIVAEGDYYENFSLGTLPAGWYLESGSNWKLSKLSSTDDNHYYALINSLMMTETDGVYSGTNVVSPKLHFGEGDAINFYLAKQGSGNGVNLFVYYSTDRSDWKLLDRVVESTTMQAEYPDAQVMPSTKGSFQGYRMALPETGDFYIRFEAGYVYMDNVFGGQLAEVDYDILSESISVSKTPKVNNAVTLTATFKNLLESALEADSYEVTFYENGKAVGAQPEALEFGFGSQSYSTVYYPHTAGDVTVSATLALKDADVVVSTEDLTFTVYEESASSDIQVGDINSSTSYAPLSYNYSNSKTEFIYTAEELGLVAGSKITQIAYLYYSTSTSDYNTTVNVWLQNTDEEALGTDFTAAEDMTQVYENTSFAALPAAGSSGNYEGSAIYQFGEPFVYTGGNLRVVVESLSDVDRNYKSVYFANDENKKRSYLYKRADVRSSYDTASASTPASYSYYFPVIIISTEVELTPNTGVVKDEEGNPIEGAAVKAESVVDEYNSIYYEATTDENGEFTFSIVRTDREDYILSVNKEAYEEYSAPVAAGEQETVVVLKKALSLYPENLYIVRTDYVNGQSKRFVASMPMTKGDEEGVYYMNEVALGNLSVSGVPIAVSEEGDEAESSSATLFCFCELNEENEPLRMYGAAENPTVISASGTFAVMSDVENCFSIASGEMCDLTVDLVNGVLTVAISVPDGIEEIVAPINSKVNVYSLQGSVLRRSVESAHATDGLSKGIYIVDGKKVMVTR